jgi:hypothetical protein
VPQILSSYHVNPCFSLESCPFCPASHIVSFTPRPAKQSYCLQHVMSVILLSLLMVECCCCCWKQGNEENVDIRLFILYALVMEFLLCRLQFLIMLFVCVCVCVCVCFEFITRSSRIYKFCEMYSSSLNRLCSTNVNHVLESPEIPFTYVFVGLVHA